ncbi:MAG TPA: GAF domain-containing protein [Chitinophagaceae bacterium]|nr:GAF domain-containing protein [Chitinophagaceae bacterium]
MSEFTEDLLSSLDLQLLETDVKTMLDSKKHLKEVLNEILNWIEFESRSDILTSILLYNHETSQLFDGAAPSLPDRYRKVISGSKTGPVAGSCGTAAFYGKQVIVEDIATDPLWKDYKSYALVEGLHSCWSTPVFNSKGDLLGTFALYYKEPRKPTERDLELIEELVEVTASAIEEKEEDFMKMIGQ